MKSLLSSLIRGPAPAAPGEAFRAGLGGMAGLACTGVLARLATGGGWSGSLLLVPPVAASAVLVFAIPASPLAQPRALVGGNVVSCLVGVTCALLIHQPALAACVAVAGAIVAMSLLGCLHPPGGAVALSASLVGGGAGLAAYADAAAPVALCSGLLAVFAAIIVPIGGRSYPHRVAVARNVHATADPPPGQRVGYTAADLDSALARYGELLDVSREDLDALFQQVELQAHRRIHSHIRCEDVMSRDVIAVDLRQSAESALTFLQQHELRTAPVIDEQRRVVGLVRRAELTAGRRRMVADVLDPFVHKVMPSTAIEALLPLLSSGVTHEAMVVDKDRVLVGVITQTDLLAVLYRAHIVEAVAAQRAA